MPSPPDDDFLIGAGSVIQVSTPELRDTAARFARVSVRLSTAGDGAMSAYLGIHAPYDADGAWQVAARAGQASIAVAAVAEDLRRTADVYDIAEARAQLGFLSAATDVGARERDARLLESRIDTLAARRPGALDEATELLERAGDAWKPGVLTASPLLHGAVDAAIGAVVGTLERARDARATGAAPRPGDAAVALTRQPVSPARAPATLAERAARIPRGAQRVRVEKTRMPDGTFRYGVYIAGTRDMTGQDPGEPFDMRSNLELFSGAESASSAAVEAALRDAGARPGDVIDITAHSQGAMVGNVLALKGEYVVATFVALGPPAVVPLGDGTLSVHVAFDDDPVAVLSAGGLPGPAGSDASIVVHGDVGGDGTTAMVPDQRTHALDRYAGLLGQAERSGDPRMRAFHEALAEVAAGHPVAASDYGARRADGVVSASSPEDAG
ncbi:hypothetical protein [Microbacterium marinilacus]|uniref:Uncharacterized protein n=1 Tax=Microbacterium marinilacus TaxID=415209 RepID=A0ABP7BTU0_9MICO|nr:hypothetical protein [Microbacterium marinilacus]MBY0689157.1 hypothetical protein [Microbacterium marinilacus]